MKNNLRWIILGLFGFGLFFGFTASISVFVFNQMKGDAYQLSLVALHENNNVIDTLGSPLEPGFLVLGSVHTNSSGGGKAGFSYSISGSKSSAEVFVTATRIDKKWMLDSVVVTPSSGGKPLQIVGPKDKAQTN